MFREIFQLSASSNVFRIMGKRVWFRRPLRLRVVTTPRHTWTWDASNPSVITPLTNSDRWMTSGAPHLMPIVTNASTTLHNAAIVAVLCISFYPSAELIYTDQDLLILIIVEAIKLRCTSLDAGPGRPGVMPRVWRPTSPPHELAATH